MPSLWLSHLIPAPNVSSNLFVLIRPPPATVSRFLPSSVGHDYVRRLPGGLSGQSSRPPLAPTSCRLWRCVSRLGFAFGTPSGTSGPSRSCALLSTPCPHRSEPFAPSSTVRWLHPAQLVVVTVTPCPAVFLFTVMRSRGSTGLVMSTVNSQPGNRLYRTEHRSAVTRSSCLGRRIGPSSGSWPTVGDCCRSNRGFRRGGLLSSSCRRVGKRCSQGRYRDRPNTTRSHRLLLWPVGRHSNAPDPCLVREASDD